MRKEKKVSHTRERCENNTKDSKIIFWILLISCLLVFGGPILINELYKLGTGYLTLWGAPDVLSYYGSILQGILTFVTLYLTIVFTKKQIRYEHQLNINQDILNQIEQEISSFVELLYPLNLFKIAILYNCDEADVEFVQAIISYQTNIKIAINALRCSIFSKKYSDLETLQEIVNTFSDSMLEYAEKMIENSHNKETIGHICIQLQEQSKCEYFKIIEIKEECIGTLKRSLADSINNTILF